MATPNWDWVFHALGWTLASLGLLLALWALFWDRSRGRKRCPKCWYSMEGAVEGENGALTCPECGRSPRSPRSLLRTRRRKKWASLAVVMMIAAWPLGQYPKASRTGWLSTLPARVVIELIPIGGIDGPFGWDVRMRLGLVPDKRGTTRVTLSPDEEVYLIRRIARGNIFARPISARWRASFGEVRRQGNGIVFRFSSDRFPMTYRDGTPSDDARHEALLEMLTIPSDTLARTRDRWPRGVPISIETKPDNWWPSGVTEDSIMRWKTKDGERFGEEKYKWNCTLDPFDQAEVQLDIEVTHLLRFWDADRDDTIARETTHHTLSWTTVDSIDDAMTPVRSDEIDAHLEEFLLAEFLTGRLGGKRPGLHLTTTGLDSLLVAGISFGVRVEIWLDDEPKGWFNGRWTSDMFGMTRSGTDWQIEGGWQAAQAYVTEHKDAGRWTLRLTTDPEWSLRNLDADKYWDGEITLPLTIK